MRWDPIACCICLDLDLAEAWVLGVFMVCHALLGAGRQLPGAAACV